MAQVFLNSTPPDTSRSRFRLPHWGWFLLATIVLVVGFVGLSIWVPYHRDRQIVQKIESWGGKVETETADHEWLLELLGEDLMKNIKVFERVKGVTLMGRTVTDGEMPHLSGLKSLTDLSLYNTTVTDAGLVHLCKMTNLRELDLGKTAVTDAGLVHLSKMTNLRQLGLGKTAVTNAGLLHLNRMTNLESLDLSGTAVTDAGLVHLSGFRVLGGLYLNGTKVTKKGIEELKTTLPYCLITY
jgi:Leucine Rich repeat